ncbi:MAG: PadR family transcriptional regulator [Chloroflexi bacterium]|nr:PadR family transcriptional regulator [Chloroflexota bacterium]MBP8056210.1 PadR family transcriptional regulator [Chloroflexota bacterium]
MSIKYAILGFLSWTPMTGYDLKKQFEESGTFYWSGNNNQIYKALVELHEAGLVTKQIQHQESLPSRKIYTVTEAGLAELRQWLLTPPELPQRRHSFLVQLAWADLLTPAELDGLLAQYEDEVHTKWLMVREQRQRVVDGPQRTARERRLWLKMGENELAFYAGELAWVREVRQGELVGSQGNSGEL